MRRFWWLALILLDACLQPRVCSANKDCPNESVCEIAPGQDGGVCRQEVFDAG